MASPIKRMRSSKLTVTENGRWFFNEQPYTGLVYRFNGDGILQDVLRVEDGREQGPSTDLLFADDPKWLRVDRDFLQEDDDPDDYHIVYKYQGKDFLGILYDFYDEGTLFRESYHRNVSLCLGDRIWYESGQIREIFFPTLKKGWYENGQLRSHRIETEQTPTTSQTTFFDEHGKLDALYLSDSHNPDWDALDNFDLSTELELYGKGINDRVVDTLLTTAKLRSIKNMVFRNTNVSPAKIESLDFSFLSELILDENKQLLPDTARRVKAKYPRCTVKYGSEEILCQHPRRVHAAHVVQSQGLYLYGGEPLSGYLYEFDEGGGLQQVLEIEAGKGPMQGEPEDDVLLSPIYAVKRRHRDFLPPHPDYDSDESRRFLLDGAEYHGMVYRFHGDGWLQEEAWYQPEKTLTRQWYADGQRKKNYSADDDYKTWFADGQLRDAVQPGFKIVFNDNGSASLIQVDFELRFLHAYDMATTAEFRGIGFTNFTIANMIRASRSRLKTLTIRGTLITDHAVASLVIDGLQTLILQDNENVNKESAQALAQKFPGCRVLFNGTVLQP